MGHIWAFYTKEEEVSLCYRLNTWLKCKIWIEYDAQILNCMDLRNSAAIEINVSVKKQHEPSWTKKQHFGLVCINANLQ